MSTDSGLPTRDVEFNGGTVEHGGIMFDVSPGTVRLPVRRRWWARPVCWIRRHRHVGTPLSIVSIAPDGTRVVMAQACARCGGAERLHVGVDCAD